MKAIGIIDCSFPLDIAKRTTFKPIIGRMLLCFSYKQFKGSIGGLDLIFLDLKGGPVQSFSRIVHRHYNYTISLGISLVSSVSRYQSIRTVLKNVGTSKLFSAEKISRLLGSSSEVTPEPVYAAAIKEMPASRQDVKNAISIYKTYRNILMSPNILSLKRTEIKEQFRAEKMPELLSSSLKVTPEPGYMATKEEMPTYIGQEKNFEGVSDHGVYVNNIGLDTRKTDKIASERIFPLLYTFAGRKTSNNLIKKTIQRMDTLPSPRDGIFSGQHSGIGVGPLSYQKYNLQGTYEDANFSHLGIRDMQTIPRGNIVILAKEDHPYTMPSSSEGNIVYPAFRNGSNRIQDIEMIEKESIENKAVRLPGKFPAALTLDLNRLTDQIYSLIQRRIRLEKERRGI